MATESPKTAHLAEDPFKAGIAAAIYDAMAGLLSDSSPEASPPLTAPELEALLEKPPESKMGDYALPCFRFAKALRKSPPDIAGKIAESLNQSVQSGGTDGPAKWMREIRATGAFLNVFINQSTMGSLCIPQINNGSWFDRPKTVRPKTDKVMVEYAAPNTHKSLHVGHARNAFLGSSLVRLLRQIGYEVVAANYYGDEGTHIAKCLWQLNRSNATPPDEGRGPWLADVYVAAEQALRGASPEEKETFDKEIGAILGAIESKSGKTFEQWRETRDWSLEDFEETFSWYNCDFDVRFHESDVSEESQAIVDEFLKKGVFKEDQGAIGIDLADYKLGFCIVRKRDGNTLYATKDLALARRKFDDYGVDRSYYVVANEQNNHFRQVFKVLELMGFQQAQNCHHLNYGMIVLPDGKMSSRAGTNVTWKDLQKQVMQELTEILKKYEGEWSPEEIHETAKRLCVGALRYGMLATDPAKEIVFDMKEWLSFDGNSGPYILYAYSRCQSLLRKANEAGISYENCSAEAYQSLDDSHDHELIRHLYDFNNAVTAAAEQAKPSLLANHLYETCRSFSRFYAHTSILKATDPTQQQARLALTQATAQTLSAGLHVLGIVPPDRM